MTECLAWIQQAGLESDIRVKDRGGKDELKGGRGVCQQK